MLLTHHAHLLRSSAPQHSLIPHDLELEQTDRFFERFGIDDARYLVEKAHIHPREAAVQLFVVRTDFITHEAQNALLKILEEPPVTARFLFIVPPDATLLPTLVSRLQVLDWQVAEGDEVVFAAFRAAALNERIAAIEAAVKRKDGAWQRAIKTGLVQHLRKQRDVAGYRELEFVSRVLLTRGAANKMLLEHVALLL